ncbi:MAG: RNA 2',3'-cyclic phosphodiesterase [Oscillospiraceae bacterium]|nr:RNA 2',3'-cyclic phosphodiesterase [Oscillospiraceae bacterium]
MRLFIAINFNQETKERLQILSDELRTASSRGRYCLPENFHLTLAFLGECDAKQTAAAKAAMDTAVFDPFDIQINHIGRFKRNSGDIWWVGVCENKTLFELHHTLVTGLKENGLAVEKREFNPHITLGREVFTNAQPRQIDPFGETVSRIDLMKSEHIDGKLIYTSIYRRGKWTNPIIIEPYNPAWEIEFERIRTFLRPHISDLIVEIHHVGSTSVPGLSAKPIIDFDIEIESMDMFPQLKERLGELGFQHEGDYGITGREAFKPTLPDDFMQYHMYVCPSDSTEFERHLQFKNTLCANPQMANEYGELKMSLAKKHGSDIDAYIEGKTPFIRSVLGIC